MLDVSRTLNQMLDGKAKRDRQSREREVKSNGPRHSHGPRHNPRRSFPDKERSRSSSMTKQSISLGPDECIVKDLKAENFTKKEKRDRTSLTLSCVTEAMNVNEEMSESIQSIPQRLARNRTERKVKSNRILRASIAEGYEDDRIYDSPPHMMWKQDMLRVPDHRRGRLRTTKWKSINPTRQSHSDESRERRRKRPKKIRRPSWKDESEDEITSCPSLNLHLSSLSGSSIRSSRSCTPPDVMVKDLHAEEYVQRSLLRADRRAEKSSMALPCLIENMVCGRETNEVTSLQTLTRNKEIRRKKSIQIFHNTIAEEHEDALIFETSSTGPKETSYTGRLRTQVDEKRNTKSREEKHSNVYEDEKKRLRPTKLSLTIDRGNGLLSSDSWPTSLTTPSSDDLGDNKKAAYYQKLYEDSKREVKILRRELCNKQEEIETMKNQVSEIKLGIDSESAVPKARTI